MLRSITHASKSLVPNFLPPYHASSGSLHLRRRSDDPAALWPACGRLCFFFAQGPGKISRRKIMSIYTKSARFDQTHSLTGA